MRGVEQSRIISPRFINYELERVEWEPASGLLAEAHQLNKTDFPGLLIKDKEEM